MHFKHDCPLPLQGLKGRSSRNCFFGAFRGPLAIREFGRTLAHIRHRLALRKRFVPIRVAILGKPCSCRYVPVRLCMQVEVRSGEWGKDDEMVTFTLLIV